VTLAVKPPAGTKTAPKFHQMKNIRQGLLNPISAPLNGKGKIEPFMNHLSLFTVYFFAL
jgi:hypothetical protein